MDTVVSLSVMERLRKELEQKTFSLEDGATLQATASFGVAELDPNLPVEAALDRADKALYTAKGAGRNCVRAWDPSM